MFNHSIWARQIEDLVNNLALFRKYGERLMAGVLSKNTY